MRNKAIMEYIDIIAIRFETAPTSKFEEGLRQRDILDLLKYERILKDSLDKRRRLEESYGI